MWWVSRIASPVVFGELLDAGCDVEGVPDQGELQFACPADGPSKLLTGVDADAKFAAESFATGGQSIPSLTAASA
ncbi:MAG: hypothetical protein QOH57_3195 [Mycobacterium sp.]|nr:hypothetical protein [Mycobacterium sp.]